LNGGATHLIDVKVGVLRVVGQLIYINIGKHRAKIAIKDECGRGILFVHFR
jgi:hypothetical protein